ncbi:MAG: cyclic diguanylate phosphodiesterase [Alphaproteobacteria bacterium]|nr:cyclic diguanylate phosphodiesterase [Alphaproteobacteria bacterium]
MSSWNKAQLRDLTERSILRMELAADRAVTTIAEIHIDGLTQCSPNTIEEYRKLIFSVASIKDIRLFDGQQTCAGFNADTVSQDLAETADWEAATNATLQFAATGSAEDSRFKIRWAGDEFDVVAVLSTGGLLDDIIPAALREQVSMKVVLNNGRTVAAYQQNLANPETIMDWEPDFLIDAESQRYPITAYTSVSPGYLWDWRNFTSLEVEILIVLFSLLIGVLVGRAVFRPTGAVGEIDAALKNREFIPHYQPIVALNSGKIVGFEMLARWQRKSGEMVTPLKFIPLIENLNRVDRLTFALLQQAGAEIVPLLHENPDLKFTFNVTTDQFLSPRFFVDLQEVLIVGNFPMNCVVLEITERQEMADLELARKTVKRYAQKGIRIAIDDAGTGHNGLSSIQTLEAGILKLDKFFIDGIVENEKSRLMVEMLCQLAKEYNMNVVAEGIETAEQAAVTMAMGIHEAQGFYFSRPVPAKQLLKQVNELAIVTPGNDQDNLPATETPPLQLTAKAS